MQLQNWSIDVIRFYIPYVPVREKEGGKETERERACHQRRESVPPRGQWHQPPELLKSYFMANSDMQAGTATLCPTLFWTLEKNLLPPLSRRLQRGAQTDNLNVTFFPAVKYEAKP